MKLLAIDSSTDIASVSLLVDNESLSKEKYGQKNHAQWLLPMINDLLLEADIHLTQLDGIVFGSGPGSFTGLRIACSTAKGLAFPHDLGLIPVSTLSSIVYGVRKQSPYANKAVLAVLDAQMHQMYWSYFPQNCFFGIDQVNATEDIKLAINEEIVLAGLGIDLYWPSFPELTRSKIRTRLKFYPHAELMIGLSVQASLKPIAAAIAQPIYVRNQIIQSSEPKF